MKLALGIISIMIVITKVGHRVYYSGADLLTAFAKVKEKRSYKRQDSTPSVGSDTCLPFHGSVKESNTHQCYPNCIAHVPPFLFQLFSSPVALTCSDLFLPVSRLKDRHITLSIELLVWPSFFSEPKSN